MTINSPGEATDKQPIKQASEAPGKAPGTVLSYWNTHRRARILVLIGIIVALAASAYAAFHIYSTNKENSNTVHVSGRIEAAETHIFAATATRVNSVLVKEGDPVHKGQLIVTLDSGILKKKLGESRPMLEKALNAQRQTDAQVAAVQQEVSKAQAKSKGFFAKIFSTKSGREAKEVQMRTEMMQAKMMDMQAHSAVSSVEGARQQAASKLSYFNITSPLDGICSIRSAEPGELVSPGRVLLTLVDLKSAYLRGFVAQADIARIKIGQAAQVFLDSNATKPLSGKVTSIDNAPSFTPENVYFKDDRLRQAFGINIAIDHPDGLAKPGMSAEANIVLAPTNKN